MTNPQAVPCSWQPPCPWVRLRKHYLENYTGRNLSLYVWCVSPKLSLPSFSHTRARQLILHCNRYPMGAHKKTKNAIHIVLTRYKNETFEPSFVISTRTATFDATSYNVNIRLINYCSIKTKIQYFTLKSPPTNTGIPNFFNSYTLYNDSSTSSQHRLARISRVHPRTPRRRETQIT